MLERVRLLAWEGEAMVHAGGRDLAIGVSTMVVPFVAARSESWPLAAGKAAARTMVLRDSAAWVERDGGTAPLPDPVARHERAQFAIYGLMLLAPLADGRAGLRRQPDARGMNRLKVFHPQAPVTSLYFEADGRLAEATNSVPAADDGRRIPQRFLFSEEVMPGPVHWPRELRIEQEGKPYFELKLSRFEAAV